eukprot:TRINITY_DN10229_c0_g1_i10.p1 TRINITY_DN10229_c0_g1~~TRINITY_DN10229_c0_g1_i10.p1  ORF type:complete len:231 (-),score=46.80 TRINITY_DN10229_c0_g1_i10:74-766(-)
MGLQLQGVLNLYNNATLDGGFHCVPGFHKHFQQWVQSLPRSVFEEWKYVFPDFSKVHDLKQRVPMRAGSLVVWDCRLPHGAMFNKSDNPRYAQFVRMFPACGLDPDRARRRADCVRSSIEQAECMHVVSPIGQKVFGFSSLGQNNKTQLAPMGGAEVVNQTELLPAEPEGEVEGETKGEMEAVAEKPKGVEEEELSLIHISEPTRLLSISYAVFCLKKKKKKKSRKNENK